MKFIASVLLVFSLLIVSFSKSIVCISYTVNKDYISKNLCENRNKPQLHCNGKCHFIKTLKEESRRDNQPSDTKSNFEIQLFSEKNSDFVFSAYCSERIALSYPACKAMHPVFTFFHPPKA